MKASAAMLAALICGLSLALVACGDSSDRRPGPREPAAARTPLPAPDVELTSDEKQVWKKLPPDRSAIPVLLYHGIGPESDFSNAADASYGIGTEDFARQMTMIQHAGYETIHLQTFIDFVQNKPVDLPPRPLLLTFDDARADSWTGADGILRKLRFNAVMFVDVGRVDGGDPEYLTWQELATVQDSGRWQLQLHSGKGHTQIHYGPGSEDYGPFYAYEEQGEDFDGWRDRVHSDITWGQQTLADHASTYQPLAFAPPYGSYGQDGTNDTRIPDDLLGWLTHRYDAVFTQDVNARAQPGARQPLGRIQVTRATTGGDLHDLLLSGET
jgi:peptidoglycan/xylan/chitin deacetylase (PgdA/CDA1 family)